MKTLYILSGFNNYYNRTVKMPGNTTEDYPEPIYIVDATNFVPNDGVNTEHVVGTYDYNGQGDYLLVVDSPNQILQRWFIIDSLRNRQGQYTLTLRRDLIADYQDTIMQSPMFIEKAIVNPNNPLIFNSENMTYNQIKQNEWFLRDKTDSAWIVGYYDKTYSDGYSIELTGDRSFDTAVTVPYSTWIQENLSRTTINQIKYIVNARTGPNTRYTNWKYTVYSDEGFADRTEIGNELQSLNTKSDVTPQQLYQAFENRGFSQLDNYAKTYSISTISTQQEIDDYLSTVRNKIVRFPKEDGSGFEYYKFTVNQYAYNDYIYSVKAGSLYNEMRTIALSLFNDSNSDADSKSFKVSFAGTNYSLVPEKILTDSVKLSFTIIGQYSLEDAPYGMFAIPYPINSANLGEMVIKNTGSSQFTSITINKEISFRVASELSRKYSTGTQSGPIYDIQLLPYCPVQKIIQSDGSLDLLNDNLLYRPIETVDSEGNVTGQAGVVLFASQSSFTLDIPFTSINLGDVKMQSETTMCRLVSPNYNGQFEFNIAKNNGLSRFNVDCTYKPFQPYIHLNPDFGGLYGQDFNDSRGLICGGDFSLPRVTDAWESYQLQNKNFQEIFDRQIQNMEVTQKYQQINDIVGAIVGTGAGAAAGALTGSSMLPGIGAGIGAGVGALASAIGGITDVAINNKLRAEALDFTKDQFGYQLGNIQALPQSISKTTAFTYNNKIYPIIEFYSCTEVEETALANKIAYNSMTVMTIGTINEYKDNTWSYTKNDGSIINAKGYIKGKLIRFEDFEGEDFHVVNSISGELDKGIYLR